MTLSKEEQIIQALRTVVAQQAEALTILNEILATEPPEGKSHLDLLCERLQETPTDEAD